jgi:hypothetical protein
MLRSARAIVLAAAGAALLALPAAAQPKPLTLNPTDARNLLRKGSADALAEIKRQFPELTLEDPCAREYNEAVKAAQDEAKTCLDADNPPAGSPAAAFNALNNTQLATFCAGKTLDACVADVLKEQRKFCALNAAKAKSRAATAQQKCCASFTEKKKQLEAELKAINDRLALCLAH